MNKTVLKPDIDLGDISSDSGTSKNTLIPSKVDIIVSPKKQPHTFKKSLTEKEIIKPVISSVKESHALHDRSKTIEEEEIEFGAPSTVAEGKFNKRETFSSTNSSPNLLSTNDKHNSLSHSQSMVFNSEISKSVNVPLPAQRKRQAMAFVSPDWSKELNNLDLVQTNDPIQSKKNHFRAPSDTTNSASRAPESIYDNPNSNTIESARNPDASHSNIKSKKKLTETKRGLLGTVGRSYTDNPENNFQDEHNYIKYLEKSSTTNFDDLEKIRMVYCPGTDSANRKIIVVVSSLIPAKTVKLDRLLLYFIKTLDPFVSQYYILIYIHTNFSSENMPKFNWFRKCHSIFSRKYKKNLKELYIVQPTSLIKNVLKPFKPFISSKFWNKLHYIDDITSLYQYFSPNQLQLPDSLNILSSVPENNGQIFGVALELVMDHPMNQFAPIPILVSNAVRFIEIHGLRTEGIFRLSAPQENIQMIKDVYDNGEIFDFSGVKDVHIIAGVLKLYIRTLPDPILKFSLYSKWILSFDGTDLPSTKTRMKNLLNELPRINYLILAEILGLCVKITQHSEENKMTYKNLAICWAPNLLKSSQDNMDSVLRFAGIVNSIISLLISEYSFFFTDISHEIQ